MMRCKVNDVPFPQDSMIPPSKLSVTEDGLTAGTGLTLQILLQDWNIINPTFQ